MPGTPRASVRIEPYTEAHVYSPPNGGGFSPGSNASTDTDSHSVDSNPRPENELTRKTSAGFIPTRSVSVLAGDRKPAYNPMQFVKVGPANLYQQAQQQIKQAEEVKIARGGIKAWRDDEEDWQSNLNNWKCSRRKKTESVIERVAEVKKYEDEALERDAASRKKKTFSEMMQERSEKGRKSKTSFDLSLYTDETGETYEDDDDDGSDKYNGNHRMDQRQGEYDDDDDKAGDSSGSACENSENEPEVRDDDADGEESRVFYNHDNYSGVISGNGSSDRGDLVGASSAVALMSKSVNDLTIEPTTDDDSGFGSSLSKAPSTPHVWSVDKPTVPEDKEEAAADVDESRTQFADPKAKSEAAAAAAAAAVVSPRKSIPGASRSDEEWRRIQEMDLSILENNLIQQLEKEESERAKFAFGLVPRNDLVIDTSDMAYEQQALLLSPSSMEPPKEKPPPPPPVEPPPMTDPETNTSSELDESVDVPQDDDDDDEEIEEDVDDDERNVVVDDDDDDEEEEQFAEMFESVAHHRPSPAVAPPRSTQEPIMLQKSVLRHTVSSSSSAVSQRSSSPPSVQIRPASGTSNGPLPVRSTSVSNRVKMWETGNFPRKPAEESDDDQGSSKSSSVTTSGDSRQRFEETRPVSVLSTASTLPRPDVGVSLTKENVREMYHNPAFSARDSPLPTQQAASSTNYYQNVAELRAGGRHVEYQSDAVQYQLNSGYIGSSSDQSVPRSVSATGFGRQSQQSSVPAMQPSSHSDSSLRPAQRTEDVMWKSANGNSAWNKQDKMYGGQKQDPFIGNGYQPPQPWSDDAAKASRSRSVEDLQQQQPPHHMSHHPHNASSSALIPGIQQQKVILPSVQPQQQQHQQQQQVLQSTRQRASGQYPTGSQQRPSSQPPPPPSQVPSSAVGPRARLPARSDFAPHGHVVYQSQANNQPIYENLPPPVKRSGPVAQPVDPAPFHSSQVMGTSRNGPTVSIGPWQQQGQPSSHVPVGHGFGDPRLVGNTNNPANNTGPPMLSVSGKKKCSHCGRELGRGAAMIVESLRLFYHLECFRCCVCEAPLGNGKTGADVRVRNNRLHCHNCYSNEQGVKFSKV